MSKVNKDARSTTSLIPTCSRSPNALAAKRVATIDSRGNRDDHGLPCFPLRDGAGEPGVLGRKPTAPQTGNPGGSLEKRGLLEIRRFFCRHRTFDFHRLTGGAERAEDLSANWLKLTRRPVSRARPAAEGSDPGFDEDCCDLKTEMPGLRVATTYRLKGWGGVVSP